MPQLLIATTNPGKVADMKVALASLNGVELVSLQDVHITQDVEETGSTFLENARLKAEFYGNYSGLPALADDGGIMIEYLNGEPGVKSRRWPGYPASDKELIDLTLSKLHNIPWPDRKARLKTCLYFFHPHTKKSIFTEAEISGHIALQPVKTPQPGFPYRALFYVDQLNKMYDDLTLSEHHLVNHRVHAIQQLLPALENFLLQ